MPTIPCTGALKTLSRDGSQVTYGQKNGMNGLRRPNIASGHPIAVSAAMLRGSLAPRTHHTTFESAFTRSPPPPDPHMEDPRGPGSFT